MREFFLGAQMNDFVAKPIDSQELNQILFSWIPREKVVLSARQKKSGGTPAQTKAAVEKDPLYLELQTIPGLDAAEGLRHSGGAISGYAEILRWFCDSFNEEIRVLQEALEQANWELYTIKAHALKGIFTTMGADGLAELGKTLEFAAKEGRTTECLNRTAAFIDAMKAFRDALLDLSSFKAYVRSKPGEKQS
jgi:HPt (histidine-containing phosphotransfer) domain-containing protein